MVLISCCYSNIFCGFPKTLCLDQFWDSVWVSSRYWAVTEGELLSSLARYENLSASWSWPQTMLIRVAATGVPPACVSRMFKLLGTLTLKAFYILALDGMQLKLGSMPDHCFCFAEGKYLAWCDVALGRQLGHLGRCLFRLRLHSHMTSVVHKDTAQVYIMVWKNSMSLLCVS